MDIIAGSLELIAICMVGEKNRWGWALGIACCILWIVYVLGNKIAYGILIPTIPVLIADIYYFIKWKKKGKK